jgi:hypothetical protein
VVELDGVIEIAFFDENPDERAEDICLPSESYLTCRGVPFFAKITGTGFPF